MKHTLYITTAFLAGLLAVSCSVQQKDTPIRGDEIRFQTSVGTYSTKAAPVGYNFDKGDVIGLTAGFPVDAANVKLTADGEGALIPETPLYWAIDQTVDDKVSFAAVAPYGENYTPGEPFTFKVKSNQSSEEKYKASDLLWAVAESGPADGAVALSFAHGMSRLVVNVTSGFVDDPIKKITLTNVVLSANVDLAKGDFDATEDAKGTIQGARSESEEGEIWYFIVPPQEARSGLSVELESGNRIYCPVVDGGIPFSSGKQVNADLTIAPEGTSFTARIFDWDNGDEPVFKLGGADEGSISWYLAGRIANWKDPGLKMEEVEDGIFRYTVDMPEDDEYLVFYLWEAIRESSWDGVHYYAIFDNQYNLEEDELEIAMAPSGGTEVYIMCSGTVEIDWIPARQVLQVRQAL